MRMTLHGGPGRRSYYRLAVWVGYWLGLFVITHIPVTGGGIMRMHYADKIVHFVLYFLLVLLGGRYLILADRAVSPIKWLGFAAMYAAYAAFDEWTQQFVRRSMSLDDWLADVAGIVLATLWLLYRRRSKTLPDPNRAVE